MEKMKISESEVMKEIEKLGLDKQILTENELNRIKKIKNCMVSYLGWSDIKRCYIYYIMDIKNDFELMEVNVR